MGAPVTTTYRRVTADFEFTHRGVVYETTYTVEETPDQIERIEVEQPRDMSDAEWERIWEDVEDQAREHACIQLANSDNW